MNRITRFTTFPFRTGPSGRAVTAAFPAKFSRFVEIIRALPFGVRLRLAGIALILGIMCGGGFFTGGLHADMDTLAAMTDKDRARYGRALATRLGNDPSSLSSLSVSEIRFLFAEPGLVRTEGTITLWQYRSDHCVLDIYLDDPVGRETQRVVDYEIRPRDKASLLHSSNGKHHISKAEAQSCMRSVLNPDNPGLRMAPITAKVT